MGMLDASQNAKEVAVIVRAEKRDGDYYHVYLGQQRAISCCRMRLEQGFVTLFRGQLHLSPTVGSHRHLVSKPLPGRLAISDVLAKE